MPEFTPNINSSIEAPSVAIKRYKLRNVKILVSFNLGFVFFDSQGRVLEDIPSQFFPLLELHQNLENALRSAEYHIESATFIADRFFEGNYSHWLLNTIPRLIDRIGKVICHKPEKMAAATTFNILRT